MVPPLEESEDGNRASFPRWGKRSVFSNHFTELAVFTVIGLVSPFLSLKKGRVGSIFVRLLWPKRMEPLP